MVVEITRADDRTTVAAHVGDVLQISLGTEYDWQLDPPDGTVLTHPVQTYLLREGVQAIWLASSVGRSTITAKGEARCSAGQPCQAAAFTATVEVLP